jgi:hypothetical protein
LNHIKNINNMKSIKLIFILIFTLSFLQINAQGEKDQEKEDYKVRLFSDAEFANLHVWFNNEVQKMNLSENADNDYGSILSMHVFRMGRLIDKDQDNSKEEVILKFNEIYNKLNEDVEPVLNEDQYAQHLEIMSVFSRAVMNKLELKE